MKSVISVDRYISNSPENVREKLIKIRSAIKSIAPEAQEKISYRMPFYNYLGPLAYFGYTKKHIGLYIPPPVVKEYKKELEGYKTATAAIRFPLEKKLPISLIKKLIRARVAKNLKNYTDLQLLGGGNKTKH